MRQKPEDPERSIDLDLVRCTENAALAAWKHFGRGNKNLADEAASNAIRSMFQRIECKGIVRIGEGRKDNAPGIFTDEKLGSWREGAIPAAIALDPIDGTTLTAKGLGGAISVAAVNACCTHDGDPRRLFPAIPSHYMEKMAVGPAIACRGVALSFEQPLEVNLQLIASQLGKSVADLTVLVLDRPRHNFIIQTLRGVGCRTRLISDGDVAGAIAPSLADSGVDFYVGIGGSPEAVISAAAIKCLGGEQYCRMWPKNDAERNQLLADDHCSPQDFERVWTVHMMAPGNHLIFAATGISDSPMLPGIQRHTRHLKTHSILLRSKHRTLRFIAGHHDPDCKFTLNEFSDMRVATHDESPSLAAGCLAS